MFEMFNGLLNIEGQVRNTIIGTLEDLSEELKEPDFKNFSVTIQPINESFEFICLVYHKKDGKLTFVREITLKEILS